MSHSNRYCRDPCVRYLVPTKYVVPFLWLLLAENSVNRWQRLPLAAWGSGQLLPWTSFPPVEPQNMLMVVVVMGNLLKQRV